MKFTPEKKLKNALGRAGILETSHGAIHTPAFAAVGTKATVKALTPAHLKDIGVEVVLGNAYHLYLEPGTEVIQQAGGLGAFMGWPGPTMTDSGGFQVFSLGAAFGQKIGKVRKGSVLPAEAGIQNSLMRDSRLRGKDKETGKLVHIDEHGVTFKSYTDGSEHRFTPEKSIEIQHDIGADIIFAFDECTSPEAPYEYQREAMERTHRWARRSLEAHARAQHGTDTPARVYRAGGEQEHGMGREQALFGIVQGGRFEDLRKKSAEVIGKMELARPDGSRSGFDGFGIGGSFTKEDIDTVLGWVNAILPEEKPRHLLGIGNPLDLFGAVENGCDLFDCVAPTRRARNGSLYTTRGLIAIENAKYKADFTPIEAGCGCYTCLPREKGGSGFTKAYLAHLFRSKEILANTLATIHNLYFIAHLLKNMRVAILEGRFATFKAGFMAQYEA